MYGHKNRTLGVDYCLMPMDALSPSIAASPPPQPAPPPLTSSPNPPPVDWILKKERIFLLAQFWQQRATLAEKEVTSLKEQLANHGGSSSSSSGAAAMAPPPPDRDDPVISTSQHENQDFELAAKDKEIASLVESVQRLQSSLNQMRETNAAQMRLLEEQLDSKQEVIARLEKCLDAQRDYDEVKRELAILKNSSSNPLLTNNNPSHHEPTVNGNDSSKESPRDVVKKERPSSPPNSINPRFLLGPAGLPVEAFGSLLSEEFVATWRRSLERSLLSSSPPLHLHTNSGNNNVSGSQLGNESRSPPPPQQPSPNDSSMNDSSMHMDGSMLNGSGGGSSERLPYRFEDSLIPKSDPMEGKLQEMLRYNMDKFGSQCLDTLTIARRVRELLSIHNIGQRLFAKYVLGLSQGTVSELLSKPKPWDKLTEKGRDSYRKMHAWSADDASVFLLKSLIPKKGKEGTPGSLSSSFRCEDSGAEDRIAHILSEANQALHRNQHPSERNQSSIGNHDFTCDDNGGSKSPISMSNNNNNNNGSSNMSGGPCPPSPSGSSGRDRRLRKYENDDISQEQVARIYQEELAKLVGLRLPQSGDMDPRIPREHFQSLLFPHLFGSSLLEREDVRMALDAYHRELAKLAVSSSSSPSHFPPPLFHPNLPLPNGIGGAQDLSMPKRLSPSDTKDSEDKYDKEESGGSGGSNGGDVLRHVGSAFSLVRPKTESNSGAASPLNSILPPSGGDDSSNASPLQRMASITNSLISQPPAPAVSSPNQRPLKAVLPPITQQQFDQYNNLNTEDIVRKVKEQLSQYSISQRLFGESVLGLSQGSVSDLLARPKPWHMLTQKGREPFIRMKMFLEDENAVHKLVASQYKIAPEKLMRTGGYAGNPSPAAASKAPVKAELPKSHETSPLPPPPPPIPPPTVTTPINHGLAHDLVKKSSSSSSQGSTTPSPVMLSRPVSGGLPQQPSVYEMAALTQDLDTQHITTKIKEALLANNIGQKIFGEVVLGLSQGSVSELLSKPKPWHMLSIKGREPFIRMQLWLADPLNVERLQQLKNERREATKRKRGLPHNSASSLEAYASGAQGSSDASNDSPNESFSPGSAAAAPPNKKQRVLFSDEQKEALRLAFALDPYPNVSAIEFLARELGLSSRTITNWFHNHRMRLKQQTSSPLVQDTSLSSQPFDPVQFRVLLHQRLLELHKDKFPVLPFLNATSNSHHMEEGLDLTVSNTASRIHSDNDDDYFEEVEEEEEDMEGSIASDDSGASEGSKTQRRKRKSPPKSISSQHMGFGGGPQSRNNSGGGGGGCNLGSSRRKPVAPQWFNPSWHDDSDDEEVVINGVCVLQSPMGFSSGKGGAGNAVKDNVIGREGEVRTPPLELHANRKNCDDSEDEDGGSMTHRSDDDEEAHVPTKEHLNSKDKHRGGESGDEEGSEAYIKSELKLKEEIDGTDVDDYKSEAEYTD